MRARTRITAHRVRSFQTTIKHQARTRCTEVHGLWQFRWLMEKVPAHTIRQIGPQCIQTVVVRKVSGLVAVASGIVPTCKHACASDSPQLWVLTKGGLVSVQHLQTVQYRSTRPSRRGSPR